MRELKEILREHKPFLVILLEPKIGGEAADEVCKTARGSRKIDGVVQKQRGLVEEYGCCGMMRMLKY